MKIKAQAYPNALRSLIKSAGYRFCEVQQETGIPQRTLFEWASGKCIIPHRYRDILANLLGCSASDLAPDLSTSHLVSSSTYEQQSTPQPGLPDMDKLRRQIMQTFGMASTALMVFPQEFLRIEPWERLASALARPANMDASTLDHFNRLMTWFWKLSNEHGLNTVEQLLPTFLPQLSNFAQKTSEHQGTAARLASQGYQLTYVIASQREDFAVALTACQQGRYYAGLAGDTNLQASALIRQGVTFLRRKRPYQALEAYQQALPLVDQISPLVKTRLYASLGEVYGKLQQKKEALHHIGLAYDSFPDNSQVDPSSLFIHFPYASLFLHEGLALLDLHQPAQAALALEQVDGLYPKLEISERNRLDFLNQQALAAGQQRDLDRFGIYMEEVITSARKLGSDLRVSEAWDVFVKTREQWKYEPRMQVVGKLFAR